MRSGFSALPGTGSVLAFAHRGGAKHPDLLGLENTLAAFAHAVALGYRHLETDVHLTRDGVLVAFHDAVLERVTDGVGRIEDLAWSDLAGIRIAGHEPVPTLPDLVEAFPRACFNIDIKAEAAVVPLARFVAERGLHARVLVASFSGRRLRRFRRNAPGVPTAASPVEVAAYVVLPARLARRLTPHVAALQVPHRVGRIPVVTSRLVRRAHSAGIPVHVWTVDDSAEMRQLLDRGVDGLMTDRTDLLRDVLRERGLWPAAPRADER